MLQTQQTKKKNSSIFNYPTTNKKMITKIKEDFILLSGKEKENDAPLNPSRFGLTNRGD